METPRRTSTSRTKAAAPTTGKRLLLRVHSAQHLQHASSSLGVYCKLYVGETAMTSGSQKSLFRKKSSSSDDVDEKSKHRVFRTSTIPHEEADSVALWDENFDVVVVDATKEILSVRVKSKHRLYPAVLGVCAIHLKGLREGRMVDQSFPLMKGHREVASLRMQLLLSPSSDHQQQHHQQHHVKCSDLQADIKTALAANHAADEAIERLLATAVNKTNSTKRLPVSGGIDHPPSTATTNKSPVYSA